jgi:hypothetical protein
MATKKIDPTKPLPSNATLQQQVDYYTERGNTVKMPFRAEKENLKLLAQAQTALAATEPKYSAGPSISTLQAQEAAADAKIKADALAKANNAATNAKPNNAATNAKPNGKKQVDNSLKPSAQLATEANANASKAKDVTGGLVPTAISGAPDVATAEQLLRQNYAGQWAFWHQEDTTNPDGTIKQGQLANFLDGVLKDGTLAAASAGSRAGIDNFNTRLQATNWYIKNGAQGLAAATVQKSQPRTWQDSMQNRSTAIQDEATKLGYKLDPATISNLAETSLYQAYDPIYFSSADQQSALQAKITQAARAEKLALTSGQGLTNTQELKSYVQDMGGRFTDPQINDWVNNINDPTTKTDINTYKDIVKQDAMSRYSGFSKLIDSGVTVKQLATPYMNSMANILELDPTAIDYTKDPLITKALGTTVGPDGTSQAMPMWQYEQQLRQDPRWGYTNNARESVNGMAHQVLKDFGMVS